MYNCTVMHMLCFSCKKTLALCSVSYRIHHLCCVLSTNCRSAGRVYHVLIFHQAGQYHMDSDEEGEEATFDNLDELVVFCMAHEMRVEGAEVQLREAVPCTEEVGGQVKAISFGRLCMQRFLYMSAVTFGMPSSCSSSKDKPWGGQ